MVPRFSSGIPIPLSFMEIKNTKMVSSTVENSITSFDKLSQIVWSGG
jgi:hypothetical protein